MFSSICVTLALQRHVCLPNNIKCLLQNLKITVATLLVNKTCRITKLEINSFFVSSHLLLSKSIKLNHIKSVLALWLSKRVSIHRLHLNLSQCNDTNNNSINDNDTDDDSYQFIANYLNLTKKYMLLKHRWSSRSMLVNDHIVLKSQSVGLQIF